MGFCRICYDEDCEKGSKCGLWPKKEAEMGGRSRMPKGVKSCSICGESVRYIKVNKGKAAVAFNYTGNVQHLREHVCDSVKVRSL